METQDRKNGVRQIGDVVAFATIACGLAWLVALPLWLGDGLAEPFFPLVALAMMFTPAVAAVALGWWGLRRGTKDDDGRRHARRPGRATVRAMLNRLGITTSMRDSGHRRPRTRLVGFLVLAWLLPPVLMFGGLGIAAVVGVYPADFGGLSGLRELMRQQSEALGVAMPEIPGAILIVGQLVNVLLGALINAVPELGEELGWRGWLVPRLARFGPVGVVVISGVLWGVWHAPLVLLGYNYPDLPGGWGVAAMCGLTVSFGAVLAWMRLSSDSVWPAALFHGSLNAAAGLSVVFARPEALSSLQVPPTGWTGWILPLVLGSAALAMWWRAARR
ncbi:CPBP family intramembrane glutamic endopeptidase [Zhihengliuella halotolerans]|uniref:CAAX prenyl protease-like protein n=1 Tax=Zhihengliuella halotolerans TaxID=370736 RepID=A0A4Q8AC68_9MICC|nr:CPBP family intramembrane glutamic endopeptidase [Zhihengliuella halotolerans]RZU61069.1 CAAX prenyl protease-like protein [Zhihengliuella halotolerans]